MFLSENEILMGIGGNLVAYLNKSIKKEPKIIN